MGEEGLNQIFQFLGQIVAQGGGAAAIAYLIFRLLGKNWIENKFAVNLEKFRGEQAHELEQTKSKISLLIARSIKLHEKEYEVFPQVWEKLTDAKVSLERSIRSLRSLEDLNAMDEKEFQFKLDKLELSAEEKTYLSGADPKKRNNHYIRILEWRDIVEADKKFKQFHDYLTKKRIFLDPEIKSKLDEIDDALWHTWVSKQLSFEDSENFKRSEANKSFQEKVLPLMQDIEVLVQKKIFPES